MAGTSTGVEYRDNCFDVDEDVLIFYFDSPAHTDQTRSVAGPPAESSFIFLSIQTIIICLHQSPPHHQRDNVHHDKDDYLHHIGVVLLGWGVAHHDGLLVTALRLVVLVVAAQQCFTH